ncbi:MAG: carboxypeptidase regulatory-like domain-containing protein [Gemmataceae bacterium]|nr:carboxypeptidase regulatory-like domain-containing protein [Gemmataceae bacterium]
MRGFLTDLFGDWEKQRHRSRPLGVEQLEARIVPAAYIVNTKDDDASYTANKDGGGSGSLRAVITEANKITTEAHTVTFSADAFMDSKVIDLSSLLPEIKVQVTIDGSGAGGIKLQRKTGQNVSDGLRFGRSDTSDASGSKVFGITVHEFQDDGIYIGPRVSNVQIGGTDSDAQRVIATRNGRAGVHIYGLHNGYGSSNNKIFNSYIGTDTSGETGLSNTIGILIEAKADSTVIGGMGNWSPALKYESNVIAGNSSYGIKIEDAQGTKIEGNRIGTNVNGELKADLRNGVGVRVEGTSSNTTIGVRTVRQTIGMITTEIPSNVIASSKTNGIELASGKNYVRGNYIGTNSAGTAAAGNEKYGIAVLSSSGNVIGGAAEGERNVISANGKVGTAESGGVLLDAGNNNTLEKNYIGTKADGKTALGNKNAGVHYKNYSKAAGPNALIGNKIQDGEKGVKKLDTGTDSIKLTKNTTKGNGFGIDNGGLAGTPVLGSATVAGGMLTVAGTLTSTASSTFTIEFFGNTTAHSSGYGEGEFYLGSATVTTNSSGYASFSASLENVAGAYVSATSTLTGDYGWTSQYSNNVSVSGLSSTATVGNRVTHDADADGVQDAGESGVANVLVRLYNSSGTLVASAYTSSTGYYSFAGVAPGDYYLQIVPPPGATLTTANFGSDDADSDFDAALWRTDLFTLLAGQIDRTLDAGLLF